MCCFFQVKVDNSIKDLADLKVVPGIYQKLLQQDLIKTNEGVKFKGHLVTGCQSNHVTSNINKFIDNMIENIQTRFTKLPFYYSGYICMHLIYNNNLWISFLTLLIILAAS